MRRRIGNWMEGHHRLTWLFIGFLFAFDAGLIEWLVILPNPITHLFALPIIMVSWAFILIVILELFINQSDEEKASERLYEKNRH